MTESTKDQTFKDLNLTTSETYTAMSILLYYPTGEALERLEDFYADVAAQHKLKDDDEKDT